MPHHTVYWLALEIVVLAIFALGMIGNARFWLGGAIRPGQPAARGEKVRYLLGASATAMRAGALVRVLVDGLLLRRLLRVSLLRWVMHSCLLWGMGVLFFVGSLGLMLAEKGLVPITKDTPWFAALNDFAGLMVIAGAVIAMARRAVLRERRPAALTEDSLLMVLLSIVLLSGFGLESVRLAADQVPQAAQYSFVGYRLALALAPLPLDWPLAYRAVWWLHAGTAMAFVAYVPYSKLLHLLSGPLALAANAARSARGLSRR